MSDEEIKLLLLELEKRLSKSNPPPPKNGLGGWKATGLVLSVLTAVTVPVLSVTWYASTKMNQLEALQLQLNTTRGELGEFRVVVGAEIGELRKEVQRLREAFAAYTQRVLPMIAQDSAQGQQSFFRLPTVPNAASNPPLSAVP